MLQRFSDLSAVHEELDDVFSRHQEALLRFDLSGALALLASFQKNLAGHMAFEEIDSKKRPASREILDLLDQEYMFKHLMRHHDLRERNILYRFLDAATHSKARARLLRKAAS